MSDALSSFACPRCGTLVPPGATRCSTCADRGSSESAAAGDALASPPVQARTLLSVGCLSLALAATSVGGAATFLVRQFRALRLREENREIQRGIDEDRRRYEAEQSRRHRGAAELPSSPSGKLAVLARPLPDLAGKEVSPALTVEHGGVVVLYPEGCPDCVKRLAGAEKAIGLARRAGLGAQLIVLHGTPEGVDRDRLSDLLRSCVVLDEPGAVGTELGVRHITAIVVDSDGSSVYYWGTPEEAAGMISSVAQGE
jgi:hypothetical protein